MWAYQNRQKISTGFWKSPSLRSNGNPVGWEAGTREWIPGLAHGRQELYYWATSPVLFLRQSFTKLPRLTSNLRSSCLGLQGGWDYKYLAPPLVQQQSQQCKGSCNRKVALSQEHSRLQDKNGTENKESKFQKDNWVREHLTAKGQDSSGQLDSPKEDCKTEWHQENCPPGHLSIFLQWRRWLDPTTKQPTAQKPRPFSEVCGALLFHEETQAKHIIKENLQSERVILFYFIFYYFLPGTCIGTLYI